MSGYFRMMMKYIQIFLNLPSSVFHGGSGRFLALDGGKSPVLRPAKVVPPIPPSRYFPREEQGKEKFEILLLATDGI